MSQEIERKFIVNEDFPFEPSFSYGNSIHFYIRYIIQGYFKKGNVRVRVVDRYTDPIAFLTIKSKRKGISRQEFEYEIPVDDALQMLELFCEHTIEKTRYYMKEEGKLWEVDVFAGENEGLILAEVELESEDEEIILPYFIGEEVTHDKRYYNKRLAKNPYSKWRRLYTSYFNSTEWDKENAVSIAGKSPSWYMGTEYKKLAPKFWFFEKYKTDRDELFYTEQYYKEVLDELDPEEVYNDLGQNSVLLCWEKPGEFCHRHLVADWLTKSLGVEVKEVGEEYE
jgi:adenylate cyclase